MMHIFDAPSVPMQSSSHSLPFSVMVDDLGKESGCDLSQCTRIEAFTPQNQMCHRFDCKFALLKLFGATVTRFLHP